MKILLIVSICIIVLLIILVLVISLKMSSALSNPVRKTYEFTIDRAKNEEHSYGELDSYEKEPFDVTLRDGYVIHGDIYPLDPKRVVLISHGHGDNKYTGIRFLQTFRNLGFSTVIYDLRGHGHNEPYTCTMGVNESKDLMEVLEAVKKRFPRAKIGLHGLSMGCATTVMSLKYKPDVDFVVADCGFADIEGVLKLGYKNAGVPVFLVDMADIGARLRYGYALKDMRPIDALKENTIPILFLHGEDDAFIIPENSYRMYDVTKGIKDIHTIPEAGHAFSAIVNPELYHQYVEEFLTKLGV